MTQIFCDGVSDRYQMRTLIDEFPFIAGFTTNPTLMRKVKAP